MPSIVNIRYLYQQQHHIIVIVFKSIYTRRETRSIVFLFSFHFNLNNLFHNVVYIWCWRRKRTMIFLIFSMIVENFDFMFRYVAIDFSFKTNAQLSEFLHSHFSSLYYYMCSQFLTNALLRCCIFIIHTFFLPNIALRLFP